MVLELYYVINASLLDLVILLIFFTYFNRFWQQKRNLQKRKYVTKITIKVATHYVYSISQLSSTLNHYTLM